MSKKANSISYIHQKIIIYDMVVAVIFHIIYYTVNIKGRLTLTQLYYEVFVN